MENIKLNIVFHSSVTLHIQTIVFSSYGAVKGKENGVLSLSVPVESSDVPSASHVQDPVARVQGTLTQQVNSPSVSCSIQDLLQRLSPGARGTPSAHHSTVRGFCNNVSSISPPPNSLNLHVHPSFLTAPNFILNYSFIPNHPL